MRPGRQEQSDLSALSLLVMIPVQERQNLILAVAVQSRARAQWNIQATMIHCGHVSLAWRGKNRLGVSTVSSQLLSQIR